MAATDLPCVKLSQGRILLALVSYAKKTQQTPDLIIDLALERLKDWRKRARPSTRRIANRR